MHTNNRLLKFVSGLTNVIWYVNFVCFAIGFIALIITFKEDDFLNMDPVIFKGNVPHLPGGLRAKEVLIYLDVKVTPAIIVSSFLFLFAFEALIIGVLFHLRKIFASLKQKQPFIADNVKSLKMIALLLALSTVFKILSGIVNYITLTNGIVNFNKKFMMVWESSFIGLILGAVIYIIADIFKYGIELKKETEEFV